MTDVQTADLVTDRRGAPYVRSAAIVAFAVAGTPATQGSLSYKGQTRAGRAIMAPSSKTLKPWRETVQLVAKMAIRATTPDGGWPLLGPLAVDLVFTVPKPKGAPKTRRTFPIVKPDIDKLVRACLDALTYAGAWADDSQVVSMTTDKVYPGETPNALRVPGVRIAIYRVYS